MGMIDHFNGVPREVQRKVLQKIENNWNRYDVFVVVAPVAFGKTKLAKCIADYHGSGSIIVPNTMLSEQIQDTESISSILNKNQYSNSYAYQKRREGLKGSVCVLNYYQYLANKAYNSLLLIDEAHNVVEFLKDKGGVKLWSHLDGFESGQFNNTIELLEFLQNKKKQGTSTVRTKKAISLLKKALNPESHGYTIEEDEEFYRGNIHTSIKIIPTTPRDMGYILWPRSVRKIVLLSATFSLEDLYDMGLETRRWVMIEADSPIPPENRPIQFVPLGSMGVDNREESLKNFKLWLEGILETHKSRGLIHITYSMLPLLKQLFGGVSSSRLMFHDKWDKSNVFKSWLQSPDGVLFACGMWEGISLDYDKARWQCILKVPFADLTDSAVYEKMQSRPDSYPWGAIKQLSQGTGRISRREDDFGITYIVDSDFKFLWDNNKRLFPSYVKDSLIGV